MDKRKLMSGGWFMWLLAMAISSSSEALLCLKCTDISRPQECPLVEECGTHQICYMELVLSSSGNLLYNLGCRDTRRCPTGTTTREVDTPALPGLPLARRDRTLVYSGCCDSHNLCNVELGSRPGYGADRGLICYSCTQQRDVSSCRNIKVCGRDDACYIEELAIAGQQLYTTGCRNNITCQQTAAGTVLMGRRSESSIRTKQDETRELEDAAGTGNKMMCCSADFCNSHISQDGQWSPWSVWGSCSSSCGWNGVRERHRTCTNPPPSNGGKDCVGSDVELDNTCANRDCTKELKCLHCTGSVLPHTCDTVETCGPHSACYVEQYVQSGNVLYNTGCRDIQQCAGSTVKRFLDNRDDPFICEQCCQNADVCNSKGCGNGGYSSSGGPLCYTCDQQTSSSSCNKISLCTTGQECGITVKTIAGISLFQTMCMDSQKCASTSNRDNIYPKCCNSDLCTFTGILPVPATTPVVTLASTRNPTTTTKAQTTQRPTTKTSPSHTTQSTTVPQGWSEWTSWGPCTFSSNVSQGTAHRTQVCVHTDMTVHVDCKDGQVVTQQKNCLDCEAAKVDNIYISQGSWNVGEVEVTLTCVVSGYPRPSVEWSHHDTLAASTRGDSLVIFFLTDFDVHKGIYICRANNTCAGASIHDSKQFDLP